MVRPLFFFVGWRVAVRARRRARGLCSRVTVRHRFRMTSGRRLVLPCAACAQGDAGDEADADDVHLEDGPFAGEHLRYASSNSSISSNTSSSSSSSSSSSTEDDYEAADRALVAGFARVQVSEPRPAFRFSDRAFDFRKSPIASSSETETVRA
jgi:hypothetical protein